VLDRLGAQSELEQLSPRDHAVLALGEAPCRTPYFRIDLVAITHQMPPGVEIHPL